MRRWMVLFISFSFEFTKLLTLFKNHLKYFFFVVNMYHDTAGTTFFLEGKRKFDEEKFT